MAQTLVLGLGGTGSRAVNHLAKILKAKGKQINDGEMYCAVLDTNSNDNKSINDSGTGIPVFPTSKAQNISDYIREYEHLHMLDWCPYSPTFREESMIDGASEVRIKSRIAFMDCLETEVIKDLENMINEVLDNNEGSKIRIMIVSSLSGGTGSGMFLQVALWLRKFLSRSQITIRGIFLLPDVFINTIKDIKENKTTQIRHYCNAYAAIRELNAITKIKLNGAEQLSEKITLGDLFDSELDADSGKPVFDFAFFVDYQDENGISLKDISEYEEMVGQLIYMQMHAPMRDDMYSEEDNAFLSFIESDEPLYGSCGTSRAIYPTNSVKTYCILRAAQDSLSQNWKKIDDEIKAISDKIAREEEHGNYSNEEFDFRREYIKIFDRKTSADPGTTGKDRFFLSIAKDVVNEKKHSGDDDKIFLKATDKVDDFVDLLKKTEIDTAVTKHGGMDEYEINEKNFVDADHEKEDLIKQASTDAENMEETLTAFDEKVKTYADDIIDTVFPFSMGEVNYKNLHSVYSLFTKQAFDGSTRFIHPVAARYLLYKLAARLQKEIDRNNYEDSREEALAGGDIAKFFDNPKTAETEASPEEFLESKKGPFGKEKFINEYESRYAQFINSKVALCKSYQAERLMYEVFRILLERVNGLINQMDAFFNSLESVLTKLNRDITANLADTKDDAGKTQYICATKLHKEKIYASLDFGVDKSNSEINKSLINTIYGCYCAKERDTDPDNLSYTKIDTTAAFLLESAADFRKMLEENPNNISKVDMNIYTAICKQCEIDAEHDTSTSADKVSTLDNINLETGTVEQNDDTSTVSEKAFEKYIKTLFKKAAPFLIHDMESAKDDSGAITMRPKTFWGFHPSVNEAHPALGAVLGINASLQADEEYLPNELYCYRAVYGIAAKYIPKFNELKNGKYFSNYTNIINGMVADASGKQGERAYVRTPHLDKRWHKILPYVTPEKQQQSELDFYHGFWLSVAYGIINTDADGLVRIKRFVDGGYGSTIEKTVPLVYNGEQLTKTDVALIIEALKRDEVFITCDIPSAEEKFAEELKKVKTYVGTEVLQGLMTSKEDLNPITFICRYNDSNASDIQLSAFLIGGLERIAREMAEKYNVDRSDEQIDEAKFRICKKIYDSSTRVKGKTELFSKWVEKFKNMN